MRAAFLPLCLVALATASAQEARTWTARTGQTFSAPLLAADAVRVTLDMPGRGKVTFPQSALSPVDVAFLEEWRKSNPRAPFIDPAAVAPWPAQATVSGVTVREIPGESGPKSLAWESPHFHITSDLKLPLGVVRDLATVFEATREAVMQCPLGLFIGNETAKYQVRMFQRPVDYLFNGGLPATGGAFNGKEMLILLPELGIKSTTNGLSAEHLKKLFMVKHEVTHQLLRPEGWRLPTWLDEGLAECVASWPYTQGRYSMQSLDAAMHDYLVKWRRSTDHKDIRILPPEKLMALTPEEWTAKIRNQDAYELYNSSALFVHYWLFHDGKGDSAGLAGYLDAVRRGTDAGEAERTFLFRDRKADELTEEFRKMAKKLVPEAMVE